MRRKRAPEEEQPAAAREGEDVAAVVRADAVRVQHAVAAEA